MAPTTTADVGDGGPKDAGDTSEEVGSGDVTVDTVQEVSPDTSAETDAGAETDVGPDVGADSDVTQADAVEQDAVATDGAPQ